jgi:hypothetical protein
MAKGAADILAEQFEREAESWKPDHDAVMACYALGDYIQLGLRHFRSIRDEDEAWSRKVQTGAIPFDAKIARYLRDRYDWWIKPCDGVLKCIQTFERDLDLIVENGDEFRKARALVRGILATPIDEVISSMEVVAKGQYEEL